MTFAIIANSDWKNQRKSRKGMLQCLVAQFRTREGNATHEERWLHRQPDALRKPHEAKKPADPQGRLAFLQLQIGSGGWIRTSDQLINSQLRYHCATPELR